MREFQFRFSQKLPMTTRAPYLARVILTLLLAVCAAAFGLSHEFYTQALVDGFFGFALASVVILHLRIRPRWSDASMVVAGTLIFAAIDFQLLRFQPRFVAWISFLGLSSFLVMAIRAVWAKDRGEVAVILSAWVPAFLFVASDYFASTMLEWTAAAHPKTFDLYLLSFDYSLRIELVFKAGQAYMLRPWLHNASLIGYVALAVPISVVFAGRLLRYRERAFPAMLAILVTGPVGILFYNLFPACGPHAIFQQGFPFRVFPMNQAQRLLLEPLAVTGARNAIPSLHMAWVLLAWWYSRGLSWIERLIAFSFLLLTAFATLGTGEHWFVDLIVAFPFALFIESACAYFVPWKNPARVAALAFGLASTLGWLLMLRYASRLFWTSPVVPWSLAAATIIFTVIRQARLDRAADMLRWFEEKPAKADAYPTTKISLHVNSPVPN